MTSSRDTTGSGRHPAGRQAFAHRDLLGIGQLERREILFLLDEADQWFEFNRKPVKHSDLLAGLTIINAFFENSTRTLLSFEIAGKRLGADVVNMHAAQSSVKKGETLIDTAKTLNAMHPDLLIVRHPERGAAAEVADAVDCPVINAGDGTGEHPTQALLDASTIRRRFGRIEGLTVAICGDIRHSRVARSNMLALPLLGAKVRAVAPESLMPETLPQEVAPFGALDEGIAGANVVMMLRVQHERMAETLPHAPEDYHARFGLTHERLAAHAPDALVMHPGPINRGVEISGELADDAERSLILDQVESGVAMRMACLDVLTRRLRGDGAR